MSNRYIKYFKRFLKEHGAYKAFINSYDSIFCSICLEKPKDVMEYLKICHVSVVLRYAFSFEKARGGEEFWYDVAKSWDDEMLKKVRYDRKRNKRLYEVFKR